MSDIDTLLDSTASTIFSMEDGVSVVHGSMKVDGNLEIGNQLTVPLLNVVEDMTTQTPIISSAGDYISFKKACSFKKPVEFNGGETLIGVETTYNSAYIGSPTIQAGERIIAGDSMFKLDVDESTITADRFDMTLRSLEADSVTGKKVVSPAGVIANLKVSSELIASAVYADSIQTSKFLIGELTGLSIKAAQSVTTKDLIVGGSAKMQKDLTIMGSGVNGSALTVNGGEIVANKGIVSHTRNNRFQTMQIIGSGTCNDICFRVDSKVDSLFEGDVTIRNSNLIMDGSKLVTDDIIVTPLKETSTSTTTTGIRLSTSSDWDTYQEGMVQELEAEEALTDEYDPYSQVEESMARNERNYTAIGETLKTILNPISYLMENTDDSVPSKFNIKKGVYRIDNNGNALLKNAIVEKGVFSELDAYKFKVNKLEVDKLVTTAVASNVVHTDNLLKSEGIAEFDGVVNSAADIFIESGSAVNMANNTSLTLQSGSSLVLKNGSSLEMGTSTSVKMSGDIELDLAKLVFVDSTTGSRYKIQFREANSSEGGGIVMDYSKVETETRTTDIAAQTERSASILNSKLKTLGI